MPNEDKNGIRVPHGLAAQAAAARPIPPINTATPDMVAYCYDVLLCYFAGMDCPAMPEFSAKGEFPLFVTWEKQSKSGYILRGCIGTLSPCPLKVLKNYTYNSALHDHRFPPIAEQEMPQLQCSVSLLTNYEAAADVYDWQIGKHGLMINFSDSRGTKYSATYLPEIAEEQGWNHKQTIDSLISKAGFNGRISKALLSSVETTKYQSSKSTLTYQDYLNAREATMR
jgi:uncharacterized protein (TIGR00296 family)